MLPFAMAERLLKTKIGSDANLNVVLIRNIQTMICNTDSVNLMQLLFLKNTNQQKMGHNVSVKKSTSVCTSPFDGTHPNRLLFLCPLKLSGQEGHKRSDCSTVQKS